MPMGTASWPSALHGPCHAFGSGACMECGSLHAHRPGAESLDTASACTACLQTAPCAAWCTCVSPCMSARSLQGTSARAGARASTHISLKKCMSSALEVLTLVSGRLSSLWPLKLLTVIVRSWSSSAGAGSAAKPLASCLGAPSARRAGTLGHRSSIWCSCHAATLPRLSGPGAEV